MAQILALQHNQVPLVDSLSFDDRGANGMVGEGGCSGNFPDVCDLPSDLYVGQLQRAVTWRARWRQHHGNDNARSDWAEV